MATTGMSMNSGYVPGFEVDVFISYAHVDNAPPTAKWIDCLHENIAGRLNQLLGVNNTNVWRDKRLGSAPYVFEGEIQRALASSAVLLSIASPRYVNSESCRKEISWFRESARKNGGVQVDSLSRMLCVVKTEPPSFEALESGVLRLPFYRPDDPTEEFPADSAEFAATCNTIARQIKVVLERMRSLRAASIQAQTANPRTVFVAETTKDMKDYRAQICGELTGRGHRVLPESSLPVEDKDELEAALAEILPSCDFAVHLAGKRYGAVPDGEESRSAVRLQYEWVRDHRSATLQQFVWIPEDLVEPEPRQQEFLKALSGVAHCTGLESFKDDLLDALAKKEQKPAPKPLAVQSTKQIYLVCDQRDLISPEFQQVRNHLANQGYPVELPVFEGDPAELREAELAILRESDATLIYYGNAKDLWVKSKRAEIRKSLTDLGRSSTRGVYLSTPEKDMKKAEYTTPAGRLLEKGPFPPLLVLGDCGAFEARKLQPFLDELGQE
jgi:hypothetical protein